MDITLSTVDYTNEKQCADLLKLLDNYAQDPMGGGQALSQYTHTHLISRLADMSHALSIIAYFGDKAVGLINAFEGFSTFQCKPIMNIHDIAVEPNYRNQGISQKLLHKLEMTARQKGCCKMTLEVLEGNHIAQQAYLKYGFKAYELDPQVGTALFWEKLLY